MRAGFLVIASAALAGSLAAVGPAATPAPAAASLTPLPAGTYCQGPQPGQPATGPTKVAIIMGENQSSSVLNTAPDATFEDQTLSTQCGSLTNMHGETHASEANYQALVSGQYATWALCDFPPDDNGAHACSYGPVTHYTGVPSVFSQLEATSGVSSWKTYAESMTNNCQRYDGPTTAPYAVRHNPAVYFAGISCATQDVPLTNLSADLQSLPRFSLIIPDDDDNSHNTTPGDFDNFVSTTLAELQATPDYQSGNLVVIVTFDEGSSLSDYRIGEDCTNPNQGSTQPSCQIDTWVIGRFVPAVAWSQFATHYTVLKSVERILGLPFLGHAADPGTVDFVGDSNPFNLAPQQPPPPPSYLANGGFENASPLGSGYSATSARTWVTSPVHSGSYALSVASTGTTANSAGFNTPGITGAAVTAGHVLNGSCWVQATGANLKARLRLSEGSLAGTGWTTLAETAPTTAVPVGGWTQISVSGTVLRAGDQIVMSGYSNNETTTSGSLVYDDCAVTG